MKRCPNCGSQDLLFEKKLSFTDLTGQVGINYKKSITKGTEPIYVDLCKQCGQITRFYVKDTNRNFI